MKLLLIGHGYLGREIARVFRDGGWDVVPVSLGGADGSLACDVGVAADVARLPAADFIVHCAASGHGGAEAYRHVYVDGCRNLCAAFPGVPLLFTSSTSVYAQTDGSVVTEESPATPEKETGRRLIEAENLTLAAGGTVARLAGIYGPHRSVILGKFLAGTSVIEEDGRRFLNQIHRDDAARAVFHLACSRARGIFNVSDSTPMSQLECHLSRKRGWTHKRVSNARLRATGWEPQFPSFIDAVASIAGTLDD
jgi:nucleoside-diphosphate-sugar epimerase